MQICINALQVVHTFKWVKLFVIPNLDIFIKIL